MLRITLHDKPESLTFQLEGKLTGPWVGELERCWENTRRGAPKPVVRFDLTGLTFIDAAGKKLLSTFHAQGGEFVAGGCLMRAVAAEISRASARAAAGTGMNSDEEPNEEAT